MTSTLPAQQRRGTQVPTAPGTRYLELDVAGGLPASYDGRRPVSAHGEAIGVVHRSGGRWVFLTRGV
jgi:hypothetical protein